MSNRHECSLEQKYATLDITQNRDLILTSTTSFACGAYLYHAFRLPVAVYIFMAISDHNANRLKYLDIKFGCFVFIIHDFFSCSDITSGFSYMSMMSLFSEEAITVHISEGTVQKFFKYIELNCRRIFSLGIGKSISFFWFLEPRLIMS